MLDGARDPQPDHSLENSIADEDDFNWALECVLSRAFQLPPETAKPLSFDNDEDTPQQAPEIEPPPAEETKMCLLPWIDSINHYSRVPTHMFWEANGDIGVAGDGYNQRLTQLCLRVNSWIIIIIGDPI